MNGGTGHLPLDPPQDEAGRTAYGDALRVLGGAPSVYAKFSGVARHIHGQVPADTGFYKPALHQIWRAFGPERAIYAGNWPVCQLTAPYATVFHIVRDYLADKDQETVERYFWKNACAAYKLRPRKRRRSHDVAAVPIWLRGVLSQALLMGVCNSVILEAARLGGVAAFVACAAISMLVLLLGQAPVSTNARESLLPSLFVEVCREEPARFVCKEKVHTDDFLAQEGGPG